MNQTNDNGTALGAGGVAEVMNRTAHRAMPRLVLPLRQKQSFEDLIAALVSKRRDHRTRTVKEALDWANEIVAAETKR